MAENIASRVGRLITGTANMLVDTVENMAPEVVMQEAIREVDHAIDDVRAELGKVISKQHMASRRLSDESAKHEGLSEKIQLALTEKREDLAQVAVAQLLDVEAQIPVLEATIADTKDAEKELEGYISALQARKREMKEELKQFHDAMAAADTSCGGSGDDTGHASGSSGVATSVSRAEEAFNRALEGAGGVAGSSLAPGKVDAAKRAELDDLARQNRIKERLESFKSKDS